MDINKQTLNDSFDKRSYEDKIKNSNFVLDFI